MTRVQQAQVLKRLRELQAVLARVDYGRDPELERAPGYIVGYCTSLVEVALREATAKADGQ